MDKSANRSCSFPVFRPVSAAKTVRFLGALTVLILMLAGATESLRAETWTDATGKFTIEADFVGVKADEVYLKRKSDGVTIKVPFKQLSAQSQQLARLLQGGPAQPPAAPIGRPPVMAGAVRPPAKPAFDPAARLAPVAEFLDAGTVSPGTIACTIRDRLNGSFRISGIRRVRL